MRTILITFIVFVFFGSGSGAFATEAIGFREVSVPDLDHDRPLSVALWYPIAADGPRQQIADTPVFVGVSVIRDAQPKQGPHAVVLLSHGYGGSWRNLSWLAGDLAARGYVVAAPNHPGTTFGDMNSSQTKRLWKRPDDLRRTLDWLLAHENLFGGVAANKIAAVGHSLGGWTVAELAGARWDTGLVTPHCSERFGKVACTIYGGLGMTGNSDPALATDLRDARVRAVITLDLGPARGYTRQSLADVNVPFLVMAASDDIDPDTARDNDIAATNKDSAYLAQHLPSSKTDYVVAPGTLHFSFMQVCKPDAVALIQKQSPGEEFVCRDAGSDTRQQKHLWIEDKIVGFLKTSLP